MAYASYKNVDEVIVSTQIARYPEQLCHFMTGSILQYYLLEHEKFESRVTTVNGSIQHEWGPEKSSFLHCLPEAMPLQAARHALEVANRVVNLLQDQVATLESQNETEMESSAPEMLRRFSEITPKSPLLSSKTIERIMSSRATAREQVERQQKAKEASENSLRHSNYGTANEW